MNRVIVRRAAAGLAALPAAARCRARQRPASSSDATPATRATCSREDTCRGARRGRAARRAAASPLPTPLLAFAVRHLGCAAGVMVTASHNPPADNGYKVYLGDGAQIVPPVDEEISAAIDAVGPARERAARVARRSARSHAGAELIEAFQDAEVGLSLVPTARDVSVVYTAMHGVGRDQVVGVLREGGLPAAAHRDAAGRSRSRLPHGRVPEPRGARRARPRARRSGSSAARRADRERSRCGSIGRRDPGRRRLPPAARRRARRAARRSRAAAHVRLRSPRSRRPWCRPRCSRRWPPRPASQYAETLTGFKWIARAALDRPGTRFVFGYEEALGYLVGDVVRDKDGISAAHDPGRGHRAREGRGRLSARSARRARPSARAARHGPMVGTARRRRRRRRASRR